MEDTATQQEYDKKDLKIHALLERVAQLSSDNADLRVELTLISQELEAAKGTEGQDVKGQR